MPEELRKRAALIAAALSITLIGGVAVALRPEPPAQRLLTSGTQAGQELTLLGEAPPPDRPPVLPRVSSAVAPEAASAPEASRLQPFDACTDLLGWMRGTAEGLVTAYGLPGQMGGGPMPAVGMVGPTGTRTGGSAGTGMGGGGAGGGGDAASAPADRSSTNVQEAGIDEPDVAKQDGGLLVTVGPAGVHVVDVASATPRLLTTLALPRGWGHQLHLAGPRLLVTSFEWEERDPGPSGDRRFAPHHLQRVFTLLTSYDLADPAAPRALGELRLEGGLLSSRRQDGLVRLVLRTSPGPDFVTPRDGSPEAEQAALARNRELVRASTVADWLPVAGTAQPGGPTVERPVTECAKILRTGPVHTMEMVTVVTMALDDPVRTLGATSVVGAGDIVYAGAARVFVTHALPAPSPADLVTAVHAFDTSDPRDPRHVGTGAVPGVPLNQWALSEHDGHLRIATTEFRPDGGSESAVRVLALGEGVLREVGAVGGLGKGERIFAVRYDGTTAYVVTFRQVDPLYTLDLSDPSRPRVLGELKIPGYSRYLHPLGDGLLLGIGRDADADGRELGLQVSVFDVRDLSRPRRVSQVTFDDTGSSHSAAEHDHHALLWWAPARRLVIPLTHYPSPHERESGPPPFNGAVSVAVDGQGQAVEAARLDTGQGGEGVTVRRVFARGDEVLVLTDGALIVAGMDRMDARAHVEFPRPAEGQA